MSSQSVWPLNENGEIVFSAGTGSSNVTGYLNQDVLPSADGGIPAVFPSSGVSFKQAGTGAVYRTLLEKSRDFVDARDFGLTSTGSYSQNTLSIQAAIDYLASAGGGVVTLPPWTIGLSSTIEMKEKVWLVGSTGTVLQGYHSGVLVNVANDQHQTAILRMKLIGFHDVSGVYADDLIRCAGWNAIFEDLRFDFTKKSAIRIMPNTYVCRVSRCFGQNLVYDRASLSAPLGGLHVDGFDHYIFDVEFNCKSGRTAVESSGAFVCSIYLSGSNHYVYGLMGEFGETGVYVDCVNSRFSNSRADRCMGHGWVVAGANNVFSSCQAMENGTAANNTYDGFRVTGGMNVFSSCTIPYLGTTTLRYGFVDTVQSASQKNQFIGVDVQENCGTAKFSNGNQGGGFVFNTGPYRVQSGTTIDATGKNFIWLDYSAATTVTEITGAVNGQEIRFLPTSQVVTFQYGAKIKTVSGANLDMSLQVVYVFTYWNGVLYQHS